MSRFGPLPDWTNTDNYRTSPHQAIINELASQGQLIPDELLEVRGTPTGKGILTAPGARSRVITNGVIQLYGPGGADPTKREQYWAYISRECVARVIGETAINSRIQFLPDGEDLVVVATNLAELPPYDPMGISGSASIASSHNNFNGGSWHTLRPGQQVELTGTPFRIRGAVTLVWTFTLGPKPIIAKLTGSEAVPGDDSRLRYFWREQRLSKKGDWEDTPDGLNDSSFPDTAHAYSMGDFGTGTASSAEGQIVELMGWTNKSGDLEYIFEGGGSGLPPAGEQYTGLYAVAQFRWGVDFSRLHSV